ncbi:MAG: DUF2130 domain-containing protein [Anaerolineaceae bacterium]|nr:DUF2130 domain-containing protein [Anaerolineaceae bacterium]
MDEQRIKCPNCGEEFPLDAAFRQHFELERQEAVAAALANARRTAQEQLQDREIELRQEFARDQQRSMAKVMEELKEARETLATQAQEHQQVLERERKTAEELAEQHFRLEMQGKDEEIRRMGDQLAAMERRTRQGSMELQGEALEAWLKQQLQAAFPQDSIEDVKKGQRGADLVQQVVNARGQRCGVVLWETKNAQNWSKGWLDKIHGDAERAGADLKVIVSAALPAGIKSFDLEDGVWVSNIESAPALGSVLRQQLLQLYNMKRANIGREGKMEAVYAYLVSEQFRDRVQRIVTTWEALKNQVDTEERAMQRQWKERRKQLNAMIEVTTDMYTDVSVIIGADELPQVEGLTLEALPSGEAK